MRLFEYTEKVITELESFDYPAMVHTFDHEQVAQVVAISISTFYLYGLSHRLCALSIYGLTLHYQIAPSVRNAIKH